MAKKKSEIARVSVKVQEALAKLDVDMVGVVNLRDLKGTVLEESALKLLPATQSIVVLGMEVYPEFLDLTSPERTMGTANLNDLYRRHTEILAGKLTGAAYNIARESRKVGLKAMPLPAEGPCVDGRFLEAVISYKHAAEATGLGRIGMSSLLVTYRYGPRVRLALCLTEASLKSTANDEPGACRYCNVCVLNCPAQALDKPEKGEPYIINKFACRTYIEAAGGCSECMRLCPVASPRYE
jgi:epoxyqueuosine reductase QueG